MSRAPDSCLVVGRFSEVVEVSTVTIRRAVAPGSHFGNVLPVFQFVPRFRASAFDGVGILRRGVGILVVLDADFQVGTEVVGVGMDMERCSQGFRTEVGTDSGDEPGAFRTGRNVVVGGRAYLLAGFARRCRANAHVVVTQDCLLWQYHYRLNFGEVYNKSFNQGL